jgi:hypothetical protein
MTLVTQTSGLPSNHHLTFDAVLYRTPQAEVITGSYEDGEAIKTSIPNITVVDTGELEAGYLSGYYSVRVYWTTTGELEPGQVAGELEIYKDGSKIDYTGTGDANDDGLLLCDQNSGNGTRFTLWFDPKSTYQLKFKSGVSITPTVPLIVDYIKFDQIHHFHPMMSWINASETSGGDLWMFDTNTDTVTGDGDTITTSSIITAHDFKKIYYADAFVEDDTGLMNVTRASSSTDTSIVLIFKYPTNWSNTVTFTWFVYGTVELPVIRPL